MPVADDIHLLKGIGAQSEIFRNAHEILLADVYEPLSIAASGTSGLAGKTQCGYVVHHVLLLSSIVRITKLLAGAFLFDMDGTLVDSGAIVERAWSIWAKRYNVELQELLAYSHGRPTITTMEFFGARFAPGRDWSFEAEQMRLFESSEAGATAPIAGALELLIRLNEENARWAVVTSAPRQLAEARLQAAGLPLPKVLVPADEITCGKPHPEGFLKAADQLSAKASECIVFEDTPPGVEAGLMAGMQVVGLLTTVPADRLKTKNRIRNYYDLCLIRRGAVFEVILHA